MEAFAVIGANFGDEGKGLITDYLCAGQQAIVVRFNGGAQAGHTVVTDKTRHVFHHFGSGALTGAATYLSRFFVTNPLLWQKERAELGFTPEVLIDPASPMTTPVDMLINQEIERARGDGRHGSCGVGFFETIKRNERREFATTFADASNAESLAAKLNTIRNEYAPLRLKEAGVEMSPRFVELLNSERIRDSFLEAVSEMHSRTAMCVARLLNIWKRVVFEGAQGLLLDQSHRFFPHVTPSNTGLKNVESICEDAGIKDVEAIYVTRSYMTRHGAGPFPTEDPSMTFSDATNIANEFQGRLRFGALDIDLLAKSIRDDFAQVKSVGVWPRLAVTHQDQLEVDAQVIAARCGVDCAFVADGPKREDVRFANSAAVA